MNRALANRVERLLADSDGMLRLEPAFVARDFLPPGRRLGLPEDRYDVGVRGAICERWLASTTPADNWVPHPDEGLSDIRTDDGSRLLLADAVRAAPELVLGHAYAAAHPQGLGRLAKLFDYGARLPFHIHPPQAWASRVGRRSKDEAYHFLPGVDLGAHPETFLGIHPHLARGPREEALLPYLIDWDSDLVLTTSRAFLQVPGEGFLVPSGVLHGPGTALTLELQEDSDVLAMFQALNAGRIISKELLFKDVAPADRERDGERAPLGFVDWPEVRRGVEVRVAVARPLPLTPRLVWVFSGTRKFSGQRVVGAARVGGPDRRARRLQRVRLVRAGQLGRGRADRWFAGTRRAAGRARPGDRGRRRAGRRRRRASRGLPAVRARPAPGGDLRGTGPVVIRRARHLGTVRPVRDTQHRRGVGTA